MDNLTSCWIVTEGLAGTENQCLGVAEALGLSPEIKRVALRQPWKSLSPFLKFELAQTFNPPLSPPWPDLLLAGGRKGIAAARYVKKMSGGRTFTVFLQDPRICPKNFDLVALPAHDSTRGENVIVTAAAPNRITPEKLLEEKNNFPQFESLQSPRVAVLIGGDSKAHRLTPSIMEKLCFDLKKLDAGLMITASRRTGEESRKILESSFSGTRHFLWNNAGPNPYFALLAWADYIIVTSDSVSMLSEAATTGKPVYMVPLAGGSARLDKFHRNLKDKGIVREFSGKLEPWAYEPLRDAQKIAEEIRKSLSQRERVADPGLAPGEAG